VVTLSGGAGVLLADHCAPAGLVLPPLSDQTLDALKRVLPPYAGLHNPIDVTGNIISQEDTLITALRLIVNDPVVDMMAVCLAAVSGPVGVRLAQWVTEVARETDKPVLVSWTADTASTQAGYDALLEAGVPRYDTPVRCAIGMGAMWQFVAACRREAERAREPMLSCSRPLRRQQLATARNDLTEYEAKQLLADYGIPVTAEALANSADEAVQQATAIGFPVALKVVSPDIAHKTEAGGVRIGLRDAHAARQAYDEILRNAQQHAPHANIDGVLVQAMVSGGVEVILGVTNDPLFGLAIMFGLGGIYAEVLRDVSFRILPITRSEAEAMVSEIRTFALLDGARGQPKADVHALVDTILALAALAQDVGEHISGIDINPLFVKPAGQGVVAADALIQLQR
jgi:acyl-CoA synthetase (NDP forming)